MTIQLHYYALVVFSPLFFLLLLLLQIIDSIKADMPEEFVMLISVLQVVGVEGRRSEREIENEKQNRELIHHISSESDTLTISVCAGL